VRQRGLIQTGVIAQLDKQAQHECSLLEPTRGRVTVSLPAT
jgi:hypothetical protein